MFVLSKKCVPLHPVLINTSRLTTKQKRKMKKLLFAFVALAAMSSLLAAMLRRVRLLTLFRTAPLTPPLLTPPLTPSQLTPLLRLNS